MLAGCAVDVHGLGVCEVRNKSVTPIGLYLGPSQVGAPLGALTRADNAIVNRAGQLEARRGYARFSPSVADVSQPIANVRNVAQIRDIAVFHNGAAFFDRAENDMLATHSFDVGRPPEFEHVDFEVLDGELFATTEQGVQVVYPERFVLPTLPSIEDEVLRAGVPRSPLVITFDTGGGNLLSAGESVAYRAVFAVRTSRGALLLSAPSGRATYRATATRSPWFEVVVPAELGRFLVASQVLIQVYRSQIAPAGQTPSDEMFLAYEKEVTSADVSSGSMSDQDVAIDGVLGAALYTNASQSTLGILNANERPPMARAITSYRNHAVYANTQLTPRIEGVQIIGVDAFRHHTETVSWTAGSANITVASAAEFRAGQWLTLALPFGARAFQILSIVGTTLTLSAVVPVTGSGALVTGTALLLEYDTGAGSDVIAAFPDPAVLAASLTVDEKIRQLADGFARTITLQLNVWPAPSAGSLEHTSSLLDPPGKLRFVGEVHGVEWAMWAEGDVFDGSLGVPSAMFGTRITEALPAVSEIERDAARVYLSKPDQPQAVRVLDFVSAGDESEAILKVEAINQTLMIVKELSLWQAQGPDFDRLSLLPFDDQLRCLASRTVVNLRDSLIYLTQRGVVRVAPGVPAQVISQTIDDELRRLGTNLEAVAWAAAFESEGQYILHLPANKGDAACGQAFVLTILDGAEEPYRWTRWDVAHATGVSFAKDQQERLLVATVANGTPLIEKRSETRADYGDTLRTATFSGQVTTGNQSQITVTAHGLAEGDGVLGVDATGAPVFGVVVTVASVNVVVVDRGGAGAYAGSNITLVKSTPVVIEYVPIHAGAPTFSKRWTDCSFVFERNDMRVVGARYRSTLQQGGEVSATMYRALPYQQAVRTLVPGAFRRALALSPGFEVTDPFSLVRHLGLDVRYEMANARSR